MNYPPIVQSIKDGDVYYHWRIILQGIEDDQLPYNGLPMLLLGTLAIGAALAGCWTIAAGLFIVTLLFMIGQADSNIGALTYDFPTDTCIQNRLLYLELMLIKFFIRAFQGICLAFAFFVFIWIVINRVAAWLS